MLLAMYFYYRRRDLLLGYTIAFSGMAISLSRGALAATATGFMVLMFCSWRMKRLHRSALFAAGAATLGALLVLTPALMSRYAERFKNVSVSEPAADDNTLTRVVLFSMAAEGIVAHPVLGNGTSSFQLLVTQEDVPFYSDVFWISNTELRILHDTGVIGFSLFAVFLGMIISKALKTLRRRFRPELLGLLIGLAVYAVSFQFTEGTLLAFAWIHAGLLACFVVVQRIDGPNNELELS